MVEVGDWLVDIACTPSPSRPGSATSWPQGPKGSFSNGEPTDIYVTEIKIVLCAWDEVAVYTLFTYAQLLVP
jgi:hypothetical protein